jgi:hypothetical protein
MGCSTFTRNCAPSPSPRSAWGSERSPLGEKSKTPTIQQRKGMYPEPRRTIRHMHSPFSSSSILSLLGMIKPSIGRSRFLWDCSSWEGLLADYRAPSDFRWGATLCTVYPSGGFASKVLYLLTSVNNEHRHPLLDVG